VLPNDNKQGVRIWEADLSLSDLRGIAERFSGMLLGELPERPRLKNVAFLVHCTPEPVERRNPKSVTCEWLEGLKDGKTSSAMVSARKQKGLQGELYGSDGESQMSLAS
jgi:hypothetical protein